MKFAKITNHSDYYKKGGRFKYNAFWNILKPLAIWYGINILLSFVFIIFYMIFNKTTLDDNALNTISNSLYLLITIQLLSLIVLYFYYKKDKCEYPILKEKVSNKTIIFGFSFVICFALIASIIEIPLSLLFDDTYSNMVDAFVSQGPVLMVISTCILAPLMEEVLFRGIILNNLLSKKGAWFSIIVTGIIFGLIHGNLEQAVGAGILGILLSIVYVKTRSLIPCIIGHMINNALSCIEIFLDFSTKQSIIMYVIVIALCLYPTIKFLQTKDIEIHDCNN